MKKLFTLTALVVSAFLVSAQSYRPFPESGSFWNEVHGYPQNGPCGWEYHNCTTAVHFGTDTLINAVAYHRLYYHQQCNWTWTGGPPPPPPPCQFTGSYTVSDSLLACIRQDTALRKVYIYAFGSNSEWLLYDFTLSVGSLYPQTINNFYYGMTFVAGMDSILLADGYHLRYSLALDNGFGTTDSNFVQVIEGVGSTYGLVQPFWPDIDFYNNLLCMSDSVQTIYPQASAVCHIILGINEALQSTAMEVYPVPFTDYLDIRLPEGTSARLTLYQADGRSVLSRNVSSREYTLSIPELKPGIYLLRTETEDRVIVKRLVKLN